MLDANSRYAVDHDINGPDDKLPPARPTSLLGLGSVRHHARMVWLIGALFLTIGVVYVARKPPAYTASSLLLVYDRQISNTPDPVVLPGAADIPLVQNQIEMLHSRNVLMRVVESLGLDKEGAHPDAGSVLHRLIEKFRPSPAPAVNAETARRIRAMKFLQQDLKAQRVGASHAVLVSFTASNPQQAAQIDNQITHTYLQEISRAWDAGPSKAPSLREIYRRLGPSAFIVSEAVPPVRPDGPSPALVVLAAALVGLGIGAAIAVLRDFFNNTIRTPGQVEPVLGVECLGVIPRIDPAVRNAKRRAPASTGPDPRLPPSALDAQLPRMPALGDIAAVLRDQHVRSLGLTSTAGGEGTTTLALGLATFLAARGARVLLIDGAREKPSLSRWATGARQRPAQAAGARGTPAADGDIEVQQGVHVLPLAARSGADAYSVSPALLEEAVRKARESYDAVIVDMPSLVSGPDVRAAARMLDGYLLVVKWGDTDSDLIRQALASTGEAQPKFIGAVLNMADRTALRHYGCDAQAETDMLPLHGLQTA